MPTKVIDQIINNVSNSKENQEKLKFFKSLDWF